jgi:hypothetical protein
MEKFKTTSLIISYVKNADIDKKKWDECISCAPNQLIYAYSYYLDVMSKNWDALILDDYKAVMPLTWNKKFGTSYLRQPVFTQQLGIFGNVHFTENIIKLFIDEASAIFPFVEINLNYANQYSANAIKKCNLILPLTRDFSEIQKSFRKDFVKKIKKNNLIYQPSNEVEKAIQLYKEKYSDRINLTPANFDDWKKVCILLKKKDQLFIREVISQNEELLSIALFLKDTRRIYYVMSTTLPDGRKQESNYFLLYQLIKEFSNKNLIFDFEGSEIPSIQSFFKKFGPIEQPYYFLKINRLPPLQKWTKSIYEKYKLKRKNF